MPSPPLHVRPVRPERKPSAVGLTVQFGLFLLLLAATLFLNLLSFDDFLLRLSGKPDWYLHVRMSSAPLPMADGLLMLTLLIGLIAGLRLVIQAIRRQGDKLSFGLRSLTVAGSLLAIAVIRPVHETRTLAWKAYTRDLEAAVAQLSPGQSRRLAESRLLPLHKDQRNEHIPGQRLFVRNYALGGLDAFETRSVRLFYSTNGQLEAWRYVHKTFIDMPTECLILKEYPLAKGQSTPRPCDYEEV